MIGTEFLDGQGLGNQLFCYVTTRCLAIDNGAEFGTAGQDHFANNIHSQNSMYFMNVYLGTCITDDEKYSKYYEKEERRFIDTCEHDMTHGCYISGADENLLTRLQDNTLVYGNLQSEKYFLHHKDEICDWLQLLPQFDDYTYSRDNLCILNMRGGEYAGSGVLWLKRKYWKNAMSNMRKLRPDMEFMIVTEDVIAAKYILPNVKAYHFDMGRDYASIKNAKYLILSNSSFAFFPTFTSKTVRFVIAPKYWARHNVSDGYWSSEQNIYSGWNYQDRKGELFSAEECVAELKLYKARPEYKSQAERVATPKGATRIKVESKITSLMYRAFRKAYSTIKQNKGAK